MFMFNYIYNVVCLFLFIEIINKIQFIFIIANTITTWLPVEHNYQFIVTTSHIPTLL